MVPIESSNLTYKGFRSVTFFLVIFGYVSATALLMLAFIDAVTWKDTAFGMLSAYVIRDGVSKVAELFWTKRIADMKPDDEVKPV